MGSQACKCDCVNDKKEIAGAGQAVTTATGFEEDVVIKAATISKTATATPSARSHAAEKATKAQVDDTSSMEQNIVHNFQFALESEPPAPCPVPVPLEPVPEPTVPTPEPTVQVPPIAVEATEPDHEKLPDNGVSKTIKCPDPFEPPSNEALIAAKEVPIIAKVVDSEEKDMSDKAIGTRRLVFKLVANKNLEATFSELNEQEGRGLIVTSVAPTSVLLQTVDGSCGVRAGDVISQVQGKNGPAGDLLNLLRDAKVNGGPLELVVRSRPDTFEVTLQRKGDEKMGISIALRDDSNDNVEINQVTDEGAVAAWNHKHPTLQVVDGDCIMAVNGITKNPSDMIGHMQDSWSKGAKLCLQIASNASEAKRDTK